MSGTSLGSTTTGSTLPILAIGGSASGSPTQWGWGETTTAKIGRIDSGYLQMIASGATVFQQTGAKVFNMNGGDISKASMAQVGRVINGTVITREVVNENLKALKAIGDYCRANGIGIIIEIQADLAPESDWNYQIAPVAKLANLPVIGIENDNEPEVIAPTSTYEQRAQWTVRIVEQYAKLFPNITFGNWVGGDLNKAAAWWSAYNAAAEAAGLPKLSYVVADTSWNTPWLQTPALWKSWLHDLAERLDQNEMSLKVLTDGINTNLTPEHWTSQAEQHMAMLASVQGLKVDTILVRTWQANQPTAIGPVNDSASLGGAANAIMAMYPLYQAGLITAHGAVDVFGQPQAVAKPGTTTAVSHLRIAAHQNDVALGRRVGVLISVNSGTLATGATPGVTIQGNNTTSLSIVGTQDQVNAALASLTLTTSQEGVDSLDVKVFNADGRIDNYQTTIISTAQDPSRTGGVVTFTSTPGAAGLTTAWKSASAVIGENSIIRSISMDWNTAVSGGITKAYQQIKQLSLRLPLSQSDVALIDGAPRARGASVPGNNILSTSEWRTGAYNPNKALVQVDVQRSELGFNAETGILETTRHYFAPVQPAKVMIDGGYVNYLSGGAYQVTYENTGNNPSWRSEWGYEFGSVMITVGSQGQTLERVFQGTEQTSFRSVVQVFNPYTGALWEQIFSDEPPTQSAGFMTGRVYTTQINTGDNPNWNYADWGSQRQVTTTWQDYYIISTDTAPSTPVLTVIDGSRFIGDDTWYGEPGTGLVLRGLGLPGNMITVMVNDRIVQQGVVSADGWWGLTIPGDAGSASITLSAQQGSSSSKPVAAGFLQVGSRFTGSSALFSTYLEPLARLHGMGLLREVVLSDRQPARITIDVAKWQASSNLLALVKTPYEVQLTGVPAREAASSIQNANTAVVAVEDTAANVRAQLGTLQQIQQRGRLGTILLSDPENPISLSLGEFQSNTRVLTKISNPYTLSLTNLPASMGGLSELSGVVSGWSRQGDTTLLTVDDLSGVESWSRSTLTFGNSGNLSQVLQDGDPDSKILSTRYVFDQAQRLTEQWIKPVTGGYTLTRYDPGNIKPWQTVQQIVVPGHRSAFITYTMDNGQSVAKKTETYDHAGRLSVRSDIAWDGSRIVVEFPASDALNWSQVERNYGADGSLVQETYVHRVGQEFLSTRLVYSESGEVRQEWKFRSSGGYVLTEKDVANTRDWASFVQVVGAANMLVSLDITMDDASPSRRVERVFDASGTLTLETVWLSSGSQLRVQFTKDGNTPRPSVIRYVDAAGRLISETTNQRAGTQVIGNSSVFDTRSGQLITRLSGAGQGFVAGVQVADALSMSKQPGITSLEVRDAPDIILRSLEALESLSVAGKLSAVSFLGSGDQTFSIAGLEVGKYQAVLPRLQGTKGLTVLDTPVEQAIHLSGKPWVARLSISDTALNISSRMADLLEIAKAGKLAGVVAAPGSVLSVHSSSTEFTKNVPLLSRIQGAWQISIHGIATNGSSSGSIAGVVDKIIQVADGRVQAVIRAPSARDVWSRAVVDWTSNGVLRQLNVTWAPGGANVSTRFVADSAGKITERWDSRTDGGYALTRQDTTGVARTIWSSMSVDNRNKMVSLEQKFRDGSEAWAFFDRDTSKQHHVVEASGGNARLRVTNPSGGVYYDNTVPLSAIRHDLPEQGLHFIYQNPDRTVAAGTADADYFVMGYEKTSDQYNPHIAGFDPRHDIIALPLRQYGDWAQVQSQMGQVGTSAVIRSIDGKDAVVIDGVDYRSLSNHNLMSI